MNAPRPTAAAVSGSHSSVAPSARLVTRSPRCGVPSQCSCSPAKSYFGPSALRKCRRSRRRGRQLHRPLCGPQMLKLRHPGRRQLHWPLCSPQMLKVKAPGSPVAVALAPLRSDNAGAHGAGVAGCIKPFVGIRCHQAYLRPLPTWARCQAGALLLSTQQCPASAANRPQKRAHVHHASLHTLALPDAERRARRSATCPSKLLAVPGSAARHVPRHYASLLCCPACPQRAACHAQAWQGLQRAPKALFASCPKRAVILGPCKARRVERLLTSEKKPASVWPPQQRAKQGSGRRSTPTRLAGPRPPVILTARVHLL